MSYSFALFTFMYQWSLLDIILYLHPLNISPCFFLEIRLSSYSAEDKTESWFRQCWMVCVSQRAPLCKKSTQMYHWWKTRIKLTIMVMIIARLCFIYSQIESLNQCTYDYIITIKKKFMQTVVILSTDTVDVRSIS